MHPPARRLPPNEFAAATVLQAAYAVSPQVLLAAMQALFDRTDHVREKIDTDPTVLADVPDHLRPALLSTCQFDEPIDEFAERLARVRDDTLQSALEDLYLFWDNQSDTESLLSPTSDTLRLLRAAQADVAWCPGLPSASRYGLALPAGAADDLTATAVYELLADCCRANQLVQEPVMRWIADNWSDTVVGWCHSYSMVVVPSLLHWGLLNANRLAAIIPEADEVEEQMFLALADNAERFLDADGPAFGPEAAWFSPLFCDHATVSTDDIAAVPLNAFNADWNYCMNTRSWALALLSWPRSPQRDALAALALKCGSALLQYGTIEDLALTGALLDNVAGDIDAEVAAAFMINPFSSAALLWLDRASDQAVRTAVPLLWEHTSFLAAHPRAFSVFREVPDSARFALLGPFALLSPVVSEFADNPEALRRMASLLANEFPGSVSELADVLRAL